MTDDCACCGGTDERNTDEATAAVADRWLANTDAADADASVLEAPLPGDLQRGLGRLLGDGPIETLGEWATECCRHTGGGPIDVDDLCHTEEATCHWGELDGNRYYFECFYDAVVLAARTETPVEIHTESPDGTAIEAHATGNGTLSVAPPETVVSFGVDEAFATSAPSDAFADDGGNPSLEGVYAAVCPYVRAFPDREAYERWARRVPAATVAMTLSDATAIAAALVE